MNSLELNRSKNNLITSILTSVFDYFGYTLEFGDTNLFINTHIWTKKYIINKVIHRDGGADCRRWSWQGEEWES